MKPSTKYSPEVRERTVRLVLEHQGEHDSLWSAIPSVASKLGCTAQTLRKWVRQAERDRGVRAGLRSDERERLKALEREVRELRRANEYRPVASACEPFLVASARATAARVFLPSWVPFPVAVSAPPGVR